MCLIPIENGRLLFSLTKVRLISVRTHAVVSYWGLTTNSYHADYDTIQGNRQQLQPGRKGWLLDEKCARLVGET